MLPIAVGAVPLKQDPEEWLLAPESPAGEVQLVGPVQVAVDGPLLHLEHQASILYHGSSPSIAGEFVSSSLIDLFAELHFILKCRLSLF